MSPSSSRQHTTRRVVAPDVTSHLFLLVIWHEQPVVLIRIGAQRVQPSLVAARLHVQAIGVQDVDVPLAADRDGGKLGDEPAVLVEEHGAYPQLLKGVDTVLKILDAARPSI